MYNSRGSGTFSLANLCRSFVLMTGNGYFQNLFIDMYKKLAVKNCIIGAPVYTFYLINTLSNHLIVGYTRGELEYQPRSDTNKIPNSKIIILNVCRACPEYLTQMYQWCNHELWRVNRDQWEKIAEIFLRDVKMCGYG